jgi:hypothetical protein
VPAQHSAPAHRSAPGQRPAPGPQAPRGSWAAPLAPDGGGDAVPQPLPPRGAGHGRRPHPARRGPIRGFPPVPGQPEPVYPPGQFSDWNRPSVRAAWLGISRLGDAHGEPEPEPGYSLLAISDPSADSTATQTLAAIDDGSWAPRMRRDWRSHAEDAAPLSTRRPPRPTGPEATGPGATGPGATSTGGTGAGAAGSTASGAAAGSIAAGRRGRAGHGATGEHSTSQHSTSQPGTGQHGTHQPGTGQHSTSQHSTVRRGASPRDTGPHRASDLAGQQAAGPGGQQTATAAAALAGGQQAEARSEAVPAAPAETVGGGRRPGGSGAGRAVPGRRGRGHKRSNMMMAALLLSPVLVVVLVVVGYVYVTGKHVSTASHPVTLPTHPLPTVSASPTPTLGPWKHIQNRTLDTQPLTLKELFPVHFTAGLTGARTIDKASEKCIRALIGSGLQKAVHKAHCTQVLRASYLSGDRKLMATIGVLNLLNAKAAERAGKASGTHQFIKQLAAKHGPTRRLTKGTGLEEADVLGHYLILTWAEFANLHKPSGKKQLSELKKFSTDLITGTANISLSSRMVTGSPRIP